MATKVEQSDLITVTLLPTAADVRPEFQADRVYEVKHAHIGNLLGVILWTTELETHLWVQEDGVGIDADLVDEIGQVMKNLPDHLIDTIH